MENGKALKQRSLPLRGNRYVISKLWTNTKYWRSVIIHCFCFIIFLCCVACLCLYSAYRMTDVWTISALYWSLRRVLRCFGERDIDSIEMDSVQVLESCLNGSLVSDGDGLNSARNNSTRCQDHTLISITPVSPKPFKCTHCKQEILRFLGFDKVELRVETLFAARTHNNKPQILSFNYSIFHP